MPTVQIELWALLTFLIGLLITFIGCIFGFAKVLGGQIDKRLDEKFKAQEAAREAEARSLRESIDRHNTTSEKTAEELRELDKDFRRLLAELPINYVRREDDVRRTSMIQSRLDALFQEVKAVQLQGAAHG